MSIERRTFEGRLALAAELADSVAAHINAAIEAEGVAAIAVSGGSTPSRFFMALGKHNSRVKALAEAAR